MAWVIACLARIGNSGLVDSVIGSRRDLAEYEPLYRWYEMQSLCGRCYGPLSPRKKARSCQGRSGLYLYLHATELRKGLLLITCQILTLADGWYPVQGYASPAGSHGSGLGTKKPLTGVCFVFGSGQSSYPARPSTAPRSRAKKGSRAPWIIHV